MTSTIYCRYSPRPTKEGDDERIAAQEDAESIRCQIEECSRYIEHKNLPLPITILKDPETSARQMALFDRPEGAKLKTLPRSSHIVFLDIDRAFRDTIDGLTTLDYFRKRGIHIHFANQGGNAIDASTPDGRLFLTIRLGFAEYEPRKIAERTSRGMKHRQANGELMSHPSRVPYGKRYDAVEDALVIDHDELEAMRRATELRQQGWPLEDIGWEICLLMRGGHWNPTRQNTANVLKAAKKLCV